MRSYTGVRFTEGQRFTYDSGLQEAYVALVDDDLKVPRWVAYTLTKEYSLGCDVRVSDFHADPALPKGSATPSDYDNSGYDKGHQAPAEDFAWNKDTEYDSFSMANMAPQKPGLNRQEKYHARLPRLLKASGRIRAGE